MKISDLQEILSQVVRLLDSAGGKGTADLTAFSESLEPFREATVKQFANELRSLTEAGQENRQAPRKTGRGAAVDVDSLVREVQTLYSQASDPSVSVEQIEEAVKRLEPLTKDALVRVAEGIELVGMKNKRKKSDIVGEIRRRVLSRKGASQRANLINRSPFANADVQ